MESLLRNLALQMGAAPASPGEELTPYLRFERPWSQGTLLLVLLAGTFLIVRLYLGERGGSLLYRLSLAAMRVGVLLITLFLIAEAVLVVERVDLPYLVVMADDSASMAREDQYADEAIGERARQLAAQTEQPDASRFSMVRSWLARDDARLLRRLQEQHRVRLYLVSGSARQLAEVTEPEEIAPALAAMEDVQPQGEQSRLGTGVRQVLTELRGAPPTAIVLLTDGQNTRGETLSDVAPLAARKGVPIFTIGVGDDTPPRDLALSDLVVDDVVFVGDTVRFEAKLGARGFEGTPITVRLIEAPPDSGDEAVDRGREVASVQVDAPADGTAVPFELAHRPEEVGRFDYVVVAEAQPREDRAENNRLRRTVAVREDKIKVLLVDGQPRYEYRYLKTFLERRPESIELDVVLQSADPEYSAQDAAALPNFPTATKGEGGLFEYDVIILGDADPLYFSASQLQAMAEFVTEQGGGLVFAAGEFFNPISYQGTPLEPVIPVQLSGARNPILGGEPIEPFQMELTADGRASPIFRLADDEATSLDVWENLPPHYWFLESPRAQPAAFVLARHPSAPGADGPVPLVTYQFVGAGKSLFLGVDDTWRWRIGVADRYFGRFWIQTLRFMARSRLNRDRPAELATDRSTYQSDQPVLIRARFLSTGLAPRSGEVAVEIERSGREPERLALRSSGDSSGAFEAILPNPAPGDYRVRLLPPPILEGEVPTAEFRVEAPADERDKVQLNRAELVRAAALSGGEYRSILEAENLADDLPPARKIPLDTDPPIPLWNDWRLLSLFLGLLTTEWVLRKRKQMV
ncbi:VWA domain-containing protein [Tautonia sociabilis]|uniref:VWA domain-containing protein n=1 Tax=Tautonia sociabilis TaxID=2080755 RepID=A0A432MMX2_9BACT|nr:vWA domain-containing protein [Tautonia sociabilis]RUL88445.1 VWA domain-containing protein [Tautonia sociabilis]